MAFQFFVTDVLSTTVDLTKLPENLMRHYMVRNFSGLKAVHYIVVVY